MEEDNNREAAIDWSYAGLNYSLLTEAFNPLKPELIPICYLLALLGAHHFLHVSRWELIRVLKG